MRKTFQSVVSELVDRDDSVVVLLGDIGVFAFRESMSRHPSRVINLGILEQAMLGVGAGMAMSGLNPVLHSIAPFVVERTFEQIKVDYGYQKVGGNIVSVGASYDYASLGATHHSPGDVSLLLSVPGVEVCLPGTSEELASQLKTRYNNGLLTYFRLSERENSQTVEVSPTGVSEKSSGKDVTVVAFGPTLDLAICALAEEPTIDAGLIYVNCLNADTWVELASKIQTEKILLVEPFYSFTTSAHLLEALKYRSTKIASLGVPREFIREYGTLSQIDEYIGFNTNGLRRKLVELVNA